MAREFRKFKGTITKLNPPHYAKDRNVWVMMVKENDTWIGISSRSEDKIFDYYRELQTQVSAAQLNIKVQATTLQGNWLKAAEYSVGMMEKAKVDDPHQLLNAVESHLKAKEANENVPTLSEACDLFYDKQTKRQLSHYTVRDYKRLVRCLKERFSDRNISSLTSNEMTHFIEELEHPVSQRSRYVYLKSFISFCEGKKNPFCNGVPWVKKGLIQWEPPKTDMHEIKVYTYEEIVELLKTANQKKLLPYFIFRLFGMLRFDEMKRFTDIHPTVKNHPLISIEQSRVTFNQHVYKKRSRGEHRGRFYNNVHPTFMLWLKKFEEENSSLEFTEWTERFVRRSIEGKGTDRNLLRHTAITYHCLAFRNPLQTSYIAGNSVGIIQNHYLNMNVPESDAIKLYELTPQKAKELNIL